MDPDVAGCGPESSQSAAAAVEAVRLLREEKEKGKSQGLGSANKVLKQPEVFFINELGRRDFTVAGLEVDLSIMADLC